MADTPYLQDVSTQIRPFTAKVAANGQAFTEVTHSLRGLAWIVYQLGCSLGLAAPAPQVSCLLNGIPYVSSVVLGTAMTGNLPGHPPIAMLCAIVGPPYTLLESGDILTVSVFGATSGDIFTTGAFIQEINSPSQGVMGVPAIIARPRTGTARFPYARG